MIELFYKVTIDTNHPLNHIREGMTPEYLGRLFQLDIEAMLVKTGLLEMKCEFLLADEVTP